MRQNLVCVKDAVCLISFMLHHNPRRRSYCPCSTMDKTWASVTLNIAPFVTCLETKLRSIWFYTQRSFNIPGVGILKSVHPRLRLCVTILLTTVWGCSPLLASLPLSPSSLLPSYQAFK